MQEQKKSRMLGPDLLKIAAAIFVVIIHHKYHNSDPVFVKQIVALYFILFALSLIIGGVLAYRAHAKGESTSSCVRLFIIPLGCYAALLLLRKFAVAIFLLVSGYLMASGMKKYENNIRSWYTCKNLFSRVIRFYIPFVPIFVVGLIYKIIVKDYDYTILEVIARFILGGFKPGSYYITILAEMIFVFPLIYLVVKRLGSLGVVIITLLNLAYDFACAYFGMNDILYKFLIFRFIAHIALGIYGSISDFKKDKLFNLCVFAVGFVYVFCSIYTNIYRPFMFFQWQEASFPVALFMYVPAMWFIGITRNLSYTQSRVSLFTLDFANATYHIFLIQLLYYTTFGFEMNEFVYNVMLTIPINLLVTIPVGLWYYKLLSPIEKKINNFVLKR